MEAINAGIFNILANIFSVLIPVLLLLFLLAVLLKKRLRKIVLFLIALPFLIAALPLLILIAIVASSRHKKTSYYKITKKHLFDLDKGECGEYHVFKALESFEKEGGLFLFNLYLPKNSNETTEVDALLIHPQGFFVFESKNYSGWIFGRESDRYWTQSLGGYRKGKSHKTQFYNPIRQNSTHIKYLKELLGQNIPMWSIIVFSNTCTFKNVTVSPNAHYKLVQLNELKYTLTEIMKATDTYISPSDMDTIYNKLYPYSQTDEATKNRHIEQYQ